MKYLIYIAALMLLSGCELTQTEQKMEELKEHAGNVAAASPVQKADRFSVRLVQIVRDDLAYNDRRGVYVITDHDTGKTFIGVSGIGISEIGSHTISTGKTTYTEYDER